MIKIELAEISDLDRIMKIIEACANYLISKKIFQWSEKYPNREVFKDDIKKMNYMFISINRRLLVVLCFVQLKM